jgi:diguanylate cyclase (GGDEF)-like protein
MSMPDDIGSLFTISVYVEAMLGLLLLYIWAQNPDINAVAWWGCAHLLRSGSIALFEMFGSLPDTITIDVVNAMLLISFALTWTGARLFGGRNVSLVFLFEGTIIWLIAGQMPGISESATARSLLSSGIVAAYTWFAGIELWRNNQRALVSRLPAAFMLWAQGVLFLMHTPYTVTMLRGTGAERVFGSVWLTVLSSQALLFTIAIALLLVALAKERAAYLQNTAPFLDPLTGIWNRYGFVAENNRLMQTTGRGLEDAAVLLIHIDNLGAINEGWGHLLGHRALEILAAIVKAVIRSSDLVGRLDNDKFAVVLYGVPRDRALAIADRIKSAFAEQAAIIAGQPVGATLSIGVVPHQGPMAALTELLWMAHRALSRAKESGRDRIEMLDPTYFLLPVIVALLFLNPRAATASSVPSHELGDAKENWGAQPPPNCRGEYPQLEFTVGRLSPAYPLIDSVLGECYKMY